MQYTIFCKMPGISTPEIVGTTGNMKYAQMTAVDYAKEYGHAFIKHYESGTVTHYRKAGNDIKVSLQ